MEMYIFTFLMVFLFFCFETLHLLIHHGARYKIN